jgi:hypothetical protein
MPYEGRFLCGFFTFKDISGPVFALFRSLFLTLNHRLNSGLPLFLTAQNFDISEPS